MALDSPVGTGATKSNGPAIEAGACQDGLYVIGVTLKRAKDVADLPQLPELQRPSIAVPKSAQISPGHLPSHAHCQHHCHCQMEGQRSEQHSEQHHKQQ